MRVGRLLLVLLGAATLLSAHVLAQIPAERAENCGNLLPNVIAVCSQPELGRPDWCCNELTAWNAAQCWCEPHAFDALDSVAGTGSAYSFRDGFCPGAFLRPRRGTIEPEYATCPAFDSVAADSPMEQCADVEPGALRLQREEALEKLTRDSVADAGDLSAWIARMEDLYTEDAVLDVVGLFRGQGRFEATQFFATRQRALGFAPFTAVRARETQFWRSPRMVSYAAAYDADPSMTRRDFVTFAPCSARIAGVAIVDDNYQQRYRQFWDASRSALLARYNRSAAQWCGDVAARCVGATAPFASSEACESFYDAHVRQGRVTCNAFTQAYVPQYASHGDTLACRAFYLDLAVVDPASACASVAAESNKKRCAPNECAGDAFVNPFAISPGEPQFEQTPALSCGSDACVEQWPSRAQYESIPEDAREGFPAWNSFVDGARSGANAPLPQPTPPPAAAAAAAAAAAPTAAAAPAPAPAETPEPTAAVESAITEAGPPLSATSTFEVGTAAV